MLAETTTTLIKLKTQQRVLRSPRIGKVTTKTLVLLRQKALLRPLFELGMVQFRLNCQFT